jgi:hypothetical protein
VQRYLSQPWVLDIPITGSPTTPSCAAWLDAGLQVLADTPLTHLDHVSVTLLVTGQARWVGVVQAGYARVQRETGLNDAEVAAREDALFRLLVTADAYPPRRRCATRAGSSGSPPRGPGDAASHGPGLSPQPVAASTF